MTIGKNCRALEPGIAIQECRRRHFRSGEWLKVSCRRNERSHVSRVSSASAAGGRFATLGAKVFGPYFQYGTFLRKLSHAVAKKILFAFNGLQRTLLVSHLDSNLADGWR